jgi:hypothetical protein
MSFGLAQHHMARHQHRRCLFALNPGNFAWLSMHSQALDFVSLGWRLLPGLLAAWQGFKANRHKLHLSFVLGLNYLATCVLAGALSC